MTLLTSWQAKSFVCSTLRSDPVRWHLLGVVETLGLPDCWIGAGFVRNAIWDHLHNRSTSTPTDDIDVIWFDPKLTSPGEDHRLEAILSAAEPSFKWSVKNQARMHSRNGDAPYTSAIEAMRYWPETATAVAARKAGLDDCEIGAPFGLDDLLNLTLRPTQRFSASKRGVYEDRIRSKNWLTRWPGLRKMDA